MATSSSKSSAKVQEVYVCSNCGARSVQWLGNCPQCGQWNTYAPASLPTPSAAAAAATSAARAVRLQEAVEETAAPFSCGHPALDHLLGAGLVPGSVLLLGGEPGIGKSTLLLQMTGQVARSGRTVLYASGEETLAQIRARAERLGVLSEAVLAVATTSCDDVLAILSQERPALLVLDSVQTVACPDIDGLPGNVNQVRAVATRLIEACRQLGVCALLVGHVTKDGALAGPRLLEHMVDTVLSLEGDRRQAHRLMRVFKNRFGSSEEMLVFRMERSGMNIVGDPTSFFLEDRNPDLSGTAVVMACESRRPLAVEVQALCSRSFLTIPRRVALGVDGNRLNLLLAVLEKRLKINLSQTDIYAKVGGGIRITDPGLDLGLVTAVLSSFYDIALPPKAIFFGEMDLNGQIRPVACQDLRMRQAVRLGFEPIVGPGTVHTIVELAARLFAGDMQARPRTRSGQNISSSQGTVPNTQRPQAAGQGQPGAQGPRQTAQRPAQAQATRPAQTQAASPAQAQGISAGNCMPEAQGQRGFPGADSRRARSPQQARQPQLQQLPSEGSTRNS